MTELAESSSSSSSLMVEGIYFSKIICGRSLGARSAGQAILRGETIRQGTVVALVTATGGSTQLATWQKDKSELEYLLIGALILFAGCITQQL